MTTPQFFIAINQAVNALTGGNAYTTLSTRAFIARREGKCSYPADILDKVFFWHKKYGGHCRYAYYTDMCRWNSLVTTAGKSPYFFNVYDCIGKRYYGE